MKDADGAVMARFVKYPVKSDCLMEAGQGLRIHYHDRLLDVRPFRPFSHELAQVREERSSGGEERGGEASPGRKKKKKKIRNTRVLRYYVIHGIVAPCALTKLTTARNTEQRDQSPLSTPKASLLHPIGLVGIKPETPPHTYYVPQGREGRHRPGCPPGPRFTHRRPKS